MKLLEMIGCGLITLAMFASCNSKQEPQLFSETASKIGNEQFDTIVNGKEIKIYTLTSESGIAAKITNFGGRIVSLCVPDKDGNPTDVVLGYNSISEYIHQPESFYGAAIGRCGNRIKEGKFSLDSVDYQLETNDGPNHLHGGRAGYFDAIWDVVKVSDSRIELHLLSPDGDAGYPGNLDISMAYELKDLGLSISYAATTDKKTIVNLTNHSFFNLSGEGSETINDHILQINADYYTPIDSTLIPTGELAAVAGTPMDFTTPTEIGLRVKDDFEQLIFAKGYDHNWVVNNGGNGLVKAVTIYSPKTNIQMDILTTEPGIQFYGGNFMTGWDFGKSGKPHLYRSGLCLETQHFPDSPNKPNFPSVILEPGQTYSHASVYQFSIKE